MISKNKIKELRLLQQKKYRERERKYIAEGRKISLEALQFHPNLVDLVVCTEESMDKELESFESKVLLATFDDLKKISSLKNPQEILTVIRNNKIDDSLELKTQNGLILALDSIRDPGNLGTIIRLADWFGIESIVCSFDCVDCYNPKTVQASMGAILRTNIYYQNLNEFIEQGASENFEIYGAALDGSDIYSTTLVNKAILIMGNESEGLSESVLKRLSKQLLIPNFSSKQNKSESLNVSVATSVILSEFVRQKTYSK